MRIGKSTTHSVKIPSSALNERNQMKRFYGRNKVMNLDFSGEHSL